MSKTDLMIRSLYGDPYVVRSEVGHWLLCCRNTRADMAWIREGCYAWWRYRDRLRHYQKELVRFRRQRGGAPEKS